MNTTFQHICRSGLLLVMLIGGGLLVSCNDFLDKYPDDRAEINTDDKIEKMLVSAYSTYSSGYILEYTSDNVTDNGELYTAQPNQRQLYLFQDVTSTAQDDPKSIWQGNYLAIATANQVLQAIEDSDHPEKLQPYKAEALLCRAWAIFDLANVFCMAYDPTKGDEYMGIPYPTEPGVSISDRGTIAQTYDRINADIEAALPILNDSYLTSGAKYRFNRKAAYAFAARFNLFYHNYEKAIHYANVVLGTNPAATLRDMEPLMNLGAANGEFTNAYIASSSPANLLLKTAYSLNGRSHLVSSYSRYANNYYLNLYELFWTYMPWSQGYGTSSPNCLFEAHRIYGSEQSAYYPSMWEYFEVTDQVSQTGMAHIVEPVLTSEETLMVRAEAYTLMGGEANFLLAVNDINAWMKAHCYEKYDGYRCPTMTVDNINSFINSLTEAPAEITDDAQRSIRKPLHPQGFTVSEGTQTNLLHYILELRRLETWHRGNRMQDIKRYGIEYSHPRYGLTPLVFRAGDPCGAIQLPDDVTAAGVQPNVRPVKN